MNLRYERYYKTNAPIQSYERKAWFDQVELLTNEQLFSDYSELLQGDGLKGEFTARGLEVLALIKRELLHRLKVYSFVSQEYGLEPMGI